MGSKDGCIAYHSPRQSPFVESSIGSIPHDCLDHVIVFNGAHLMRIFTPHVESYYVVITQSQTNPCSPDYGVS